MPVTIRNRKWAVDGDGCACLITPGMPAQVETAVPSARMDSEIDRQTARRDRLTAQRDAMQAELDEVTTIVDDLTALRATVTAEPA